MKDTVARWFVDAAFAVHPVQKSHTGYYMTLESGAVISASKKQKLSTRSSTEAKLVETDDAAGPMLWTFYSNKDIMYRLYSIKITGVQYLWSQMVAQVLENVPDIWTSDIFLSMT